MGEPNADHIKHLIQQKTLEMNAPFGLVARSVGKAEIAKTKAADNAIVKSGTSSATS